MRAFISYQTADKLIARSGIRIARRTGCTAFMAHEHVKVSVPGAGRSP
jgi:hypothetical protein